MKLVIQRVKGASVSVNGEAPRKTGEGLCVLFGAGKDDRDLSAIPKLADKTARLRVFSDIDGKMNLCVLDIGGSVLVVPNFTLYADTKKGNRPSFISAAEPEFAKTAYDAYVEALRGYEFRELTTGEFGADMSVEIENDGPVTIIMDTKEWER